jgi:UDP-N-acetyl-D-mannosaminuronate dehydrogenase
MGKVIRGSRVLIIGLTYKENVPDTRETPQKHVIEELKEYGVVPFGYDPVLAIDEAEKEFEIEMLVDLNQKIKFDAVVLAVAHDIFKDGPRAITLDRLAKTMNGHPVLIDIRRFFERARATQKGFCYRTL